MLGVWLKAVVLVVMRKFNSTCLAVQKQVRTSGEKSEAQVLNSRNVPPRSRSSALSSRLRSTERRACAVCRIGDEKDLNFISFTGLKKTLCAQFDSLSL